MSRLDAVVVGSGPNGLAAAVALAQAGRSVRVLEAAPEPGGGLRSAPLTLPGYLHDICAAVVPLVRASPFLSGLPLREHGLELLEPEVQLAHPLPGGGAAVVTRSVRGTAAGLGEDARAYERLFMPLVRGAPSIFEAVLGPPRALRPGPALIRFGAAAPLPATVAAARFKEEAARALLAGVSAHSTLPLEAPISAGFGLMLLTAAHAVGWPLARGGSGRIAAALVSLLESLGGSVEVDRPVRSWADLPPARVHLFDVSPRSLAEIAGGRLPAAYRRRLAGFRYGPGLFKLDWALSGPVPWTAPACARAGTVHVGGGLEEVRRSERDVADGRLPERPFVIAGQPTACDPSRAPAGAHVLWAYCHVPNGAAVDHAEMARRVEDQIERFAPGFRQVVLERHTMDPAQMEAHDPNLVGGELNGGSADWRGMLFRPRLLRPYQTPLPGVYLCSASTPPGGGVHGMSGWWAARAALQGALR